MGSLATRTVGFFLGYLLLVYGCTGHGRDKPMPIPTSETMQLWYDTPATEWVEALPIGNGRLGAMVFGGIERDRLQLNEDTVWAGQPNNNVGTGLKPHIARVRELLTAGNYEQAQVYANMHIKSSNQGMPYQTVGNLLLEFPGHGNVDNYRRALDISTAVATTTYEFKGVTYKREYLSSFTDQVIAIRLTASQKGTISFDLNFTSPQKHSTTASAGMLKIKGVSGDFDGLDGKVNFTSLIKPQISGGELVHKGQSLQVKGADSATVYIAIATNFNSYNDLSGDPNIRASRALHAAESKAFAVAKAEHIAYYKRFFDRVTLDLGQTPAMKQPTDERIAAFARSNDPQMAALYFQFGRYLLISSSQPGTQPANLQGIWNPHMRPPWDSKYTVNINTEMNYWPAEVTNLSELHQPLFSMLKDLSVTGQESASGIYGARGWMMHHNTDLWRITGQVDNAFYGQWQGGGAWLTQHIWQHYLYTGDRAFLREYYPVMRGAALFFADSLQREPSHGWLVVSPSNSPENAYLNGEIRSSISAGTTMDNQLVFDLFSNVIDAARILEIDSGFAAELQKKRAQLPPMQVGRHGQLQEWLKDWDDPEDHHRHVSHLYGLYPSNQISPYRTPALFQAARQSLIQRGDVSTGWSMGWKVNLWARLLDGNHAYKLLRNQISLTTATETSEAGGTYPNMLDAHPPFQIDGNFGVTAGIAELLMQSHDGAVHILPALPDAWPDGRVEGLVTRGGFVLGFSWKGGELQALRVHSTLGGNLRLRVNVPIELRDGTELSWAKGENPNPYFAIPHIKQPLLKVTPESLDLTPSLLFDVATEAGGSYHFVRRVN